MCGALVSDRLRVREPFGPSAPERRVLGRPPRAVPTAPLAVRLGYCKASARAGWGMGMRSGWEERGRKGSWQGRGGGKKHPKKMMGDDNIQVLPSKTSAI